MADTPLQSTRHSDSGEDQMSQDHLILDIDGDISAFSLGSSSRTATPLSSSRDYNWVEGVNASAASTQSAHAGAQSGAKEGERLEGTPKDSSFDYCSTFNDDLLSTNSLPFTFADDTHLSKKGKARRFTSSHSHAESASSAAVTAVSSGNRQPDQNRADTVARKGGIRPVWEPDEAAKDCRLCGAPFGMFVRRMGYVGPQRICEMCRQERARPRTKAKQCHPQPASPRDSAIHSLKPLSSEDAQRRLSLSELEEAVDAPENTRVPLRRGSSSTDLSTATQKGMVDIALTRSTSAVVDRPRPVTNELPAASLPLYADNPTTGSARIHYFRLHVCNVSSYSVLGWQTCNITDTHIRFGKVRSIALRDVLAVETTAIAEGDEQCEVYCYPWCDEKPDTSLESVERCGPANPISFSSSPTSSVSSSSLHNGHIITTRRMLRRREVIFRLRAESGRDISKVAAVLCAAVKHLHAMYLMRTPSIRCNLTQEQIDQVGSFSSTSATPISITTENESLSGSSCSPVIGCSSEKASQEKLSLNVSATSDTSAVSEAPSDAVSTASISAADLDRFIGANRHFLVLINPVGGKSNACSVFDSIKHILRLSGAKVTPVVTERFKHAEDLAREMPLDVYTAVVCVSGDGTVHEVLQGFHHRPDWKRAINIPVSQIPAGSGNGLSMSLGFPDPVTAAFSIAKGFRRGIDLLRLSQRLEQPRFSFLSMNWGIFSDVDFESESYRFLGNLRFTVGSMIRLVNLRSYTARLRYLPAPTLEGDTVFCKPETLSGDYCTACFRAEEFANYERSVSEAKGGDYHNISRPNSPSARLDMDGGPEHNVSLSAMYPQVGDDWVTVEGEFVFAAAINLPELAEGFRLAPFAHFCDSTFDLLYAMKCPRSVLVSLLMEVENGQFVNGKAFNQNKNLCYRKAKAFILEPLSNDGVFGADGEKLPSYTPLRGDVIRAGGNIGSI